MDMYAIIMPVFTFDEVTCYSGDFIMHGGWLTLDVNANNRLVTTNSSISMGING